MRRVLILLLALLLPLQFTWAATAVYCGHEGSVAAPGAAVAEPASIGATGIVLASIAKDPAHHFGHHEHEHHAEPKKDLPKKDAQKPLSVDLDCGVCHAGASSVIGAGLQLQAPAAPDSIHAAPAVAALASAFARTPDRPQWPVLA
jgi:hypothetical protein